MIGAVRLSRRNHLLSHLTFTFMYFARKGYAMWSNIYVVFWSMSFNSVRKPQWTNLLQKKNGFILLLVKNKSAVDYVYPGFYVLTHGTGRKPGN